MYSGDDIRIIHDPFEVIRARPSMYAPSGGTPEGLAYLLISDALLFGARSVRTDVVNGWLLVSADIDWLLAPYQRDLQPLSLFRRMVHVPAFGPNSLRGEVIVAALAEACAIAVPNECVRAFGDIDPTADVVAACCPSSYARTVAFLPKSS